MYLTQKNRVHVASKADFAIMRRLSRLAKNLYNVTLYAVKEHRKTTGRFLKYTEAYHAVKHDVNYQRLPSQVAQQTMKHVHRAFVSFFGLLKAKQQGTVTGPAKEPHYLPRDGFFVCVFPKDQFKVLGNKVRLSLGRNMKRFTGQQYLFFTLPSNIKDRKIKEVRLVPRYHARWFDIEYVYEAPEPAVTVPAFDPHAYLSIDLGLDNLATLVSTRGPPVLVDGRVLKSYNRWWNKRKAELQGRYTRQGIRDGEAMTTLMKQRDGYVRNYLAQAVTIIIKYCLEHRVGNVIAGDFSSIKQNGNLGKVNNQNFQCIPYSLFKQKLRSSCQQNGINYQEQEESSTSITCSACGNVDTGARVHRGLYVCSNSNCRKVFNADINAAVNILKKVIPNPPWIGASGAVNPPVRCHVLPR